MLYIMLKEVIRMKTIKKEKKNQKFAKMVSMLLCITMLIGMCSITSMASADNSICLFETFSVGTASFNSSSELLASEISMWGENRFGFMSDSYNKALEVHGGGTGTQGAGFDKNFGKIIDTGKLHLSYNFKNTATDKMEYGISLISTFGGLNASTPHDGYNTNYIDVNSLAKTMVLSTDETDDGNDTEGVIKCHEKTSSTSVVNAGTYESGKWNKADIVYDFDLGTYTAFLNGVRVGTGELDGGIKGLRGMIYPGNGRSVADYAGNVSAYLDDLYLHEYKNDEKISLACDNITYEDGCYIATISLSEYVGDISADDFAFTDAASGEEIVFEDSGLEGLNSTFVVLLPETCAGKEVVISNYSDLVGAATGATEITPITLRIPKENNGKGKYYYMKENFNIYSEGIPASWNLGYYGAPRSDSRFLIDDTVDSASLGSFSTITNSIDSTKALGIGKIDDSTNTKALYYWFKSKTPAAGDFTVEFDSYREANSGWSLYYILSEDYAEDIEKGVTSFKDTNRMSRKLAYTDTNGKLYTTINMQLNRQDDTGLTVPEGWSHIKISVNMDTNQYTFSVNNGEAKTVNLSNLFQSLLINGISGIGFNRISAQSGAVGIDNVEVYRNTNTYLFDDFNDHSVAYVQGTDSNNWGWTRAEAAARGIDDGSSARYFFSSGGWVDPDVSDFTTNPDLSASGFTRSNTKKYGLTPSNATASNKNGLIQATTESADNYWTASEYTNGEKVLALVPRLMADANSVKSQKRIQRFTDVPIAPGTPFNIEFEFYAGDIKNAAWGISLIEEGDIYSKKNLILGYSGTCGNTGKQNNGYKALFSTDGYNSLEECLADSKTTGKLLTLFKTADNKAFSQGLYTQNANYGISPASFLPENNKLQKVILSVIPNSDGTAVVKYTLEKTGISGSVTVHRNFNQKSIVGIALDVMDVNYSDIGLVAGSQKTYDSYRYILFDNLNIYETDRNLQKVGSNSAHIESVYAVNAIGEKTPIGASIPKNTKKIEINFSASVADTVKGEGVIELRNTKANKCMDCEKVVSEDGKKVTLVPPSGIFNEDAKYNLWVDISCQFKSGNTDQLSEKYIKEFSCVDSGDDDKVCISNARFMNPITIYDENKEAIGVDFSMLKPVKSLSDINENTKFYVNGSSMGNVNVSLLLGYYSQIGYANALVDANIDTVTVTEGEFSKSLDLDMPDDELGVSSIKGFIWNAVNFSPYVKANEIK